MRKFVFASLIAMLFVAFSATAQNNEIQPPTEDKVAVGAIGGTVDVTALGGASYSIPIQVPEGIGGIQPNLSVVYNSQSGNGLLGWGWTLGGISAITRVGQTDYHDGRVTGVALDYHDRFALDGQRLMVLDGAAYGSNGAEYRTEVDGMSKVVSYTETIHVNGGGLFGQGSYDYEIISHFKVFTADGKILYYGKVDNEPDNARVIDASEVEKKVVMWLLKRVEDRMGNYMVYNYIIDDVGHNYRLDNIQYCANTHARDANEPGRGTKYGIDFHYKKNRVDKESMAIGNYILYQPWLLEMISIYHWSQPLSKYEFVYDNNSGQLGTHNYYNRLMEIHYDFEGLSYNPTIIDWGEFPDPSNVYNTNDMYISLIERDATESVPLSERVKFAGDFNGDGLQDLIVVGERTGFGYKVYALINEGHTKTDDISGNLHFGHMGTFTIPYNLRWIHVRDFDGDGIDEVMFVGHFTTSSSQATYDVFKLQPINRGETVGDKPQPTKETRYTAVFVPVDNSVQTFSIFGYGSDFVWYNSSVLEFHITDNKDYSFIAGDFLGKGHCDIIFTFPYKHFVYIYYDEQTHRFEQRVSVADWNALRYVPGDFDGDGKTEVWFDSEFDDAPGGIAKVYINTEGRFSWYPVANMMDNRNRNYIGDFNGDGHADFLTFRKDSKTWQILLFKRDWHSYPVFDVTNIMHKYFGKEDPDHANFSIEGREGLSFFLEVADVDGDGKSDIMLRNNKKSTKGDYKFAVLYGPPSEQGFSRVEEFDATGSLGLESASGLCVGNFLSQENISLIAEILLYSFPQHSIYYNVKSVTDGMGNRAAFDYGYLVNNPMKSDNIYDVDCIGQDRGFDLYSVPLPMKAVRTLTTSNVNVPAQAHAEDSFSYANLIVHRKGKGILGFVGITRDSWQLGNPANDGLEARHISKQVRTFSLKPMQEHRALVPESAGLYRYRDDGEEVMTASTNYHYAKGLCQRDMNSVGIKVFTPLAMTTFADEHELLGERGHLRRRITENDYDGQLQNGLYKYQHAIRMTETRQGTDSETPGVVSLCEFQTTTHTEYASMLNSGDLWMPNRPHSILTQSKRLTPGYADAKSLDVYYYDPERPYLPKYVKTYPSGVESENDALAMTAYYTYHPTGRLKDESHYPVVGRSVGGFKTMYEYSPDNRFLTKKTEEYDHTHTKDYETGYEYDNIYGNQKTETDCNGYSTWYENPDHLGLTVRSYRRDNDENRTRIAGTETVTALRWLAGSAYQSHGEGLDSPSYFTWKRSSGGAEALTIYDALGRELRTVSHSLPENGTSKIVYKDTQYDNWGRLHKVSEPYFKGLPLVQRKWTTYTYGDFDRIDTLYNQQYTVDGQTIQPYTRYEYDGLTTTTTSGVVDGTETHVTATTLNIMGWTESNSEVIDGNGTENTTTYGHNADGSLAWSMVNGNESTKIGLRYDDAGNRKELSDPNYGTVTDIYNAFGQLDYTISPKGDVTAYEYDNLGRMKTRTETSHSNPTEPVRHTTWSYSETPGKKGLLEGIELKEGKNVTQTIAYTYNMQRYNRLAYKTEILSTTRYLTAYAYDDQNGHPLRLKATTYPTGFVMEREYDAQTGRLRQLKHGSTVLWTTESMNALGQITRYTTGNGAVTDIAYDDRHLTKRQVTRVANQNILQDFGYSYDIFANLAARTDNLRNLEETFIYDHLNRLTDVWLNNVHTGHMAYDALGRMTDKRTDGQQVFSAAQHDYVGPDGQLRPHAVSSAQTGGNPFPTEQLDITYTMFDKVRSIADGIFMSKTVEFEYGYDHQRTRMRMEDPDGSRYEKRYVGGCEFVEHDGIIDKYTYLCGPLGVFAVNKLEVNGCHFVDRLHYVYKDHLGSWTTITDANGTVVREQSFDAWGNMRDPDTWTGYTAPELAEGPMFDRGYTGHEHLNSFGLINMNGRMYDPIMSSFLSVDNYVQAPDFSQSFNRYAYCLNNPLRYVDPDGEWFLTGGVGFGKREDGTYGLTSVSVGVNFGYFGFGVNLGFDNRGFSSIGVYGELGPHVGSAGANLTLSVGYDFRYQTTTASLSAGYGFSYGIGRAGVGASGSYTWGGPSGVSPWNANVSASLGLAGSVNKFGQTAGLGIGCSYGTQGWGFGAHSYCEILPAQEKLDRIVRYYSSDLKETFGESGVGDVYAGTRRNMKFAKGKLSVYGGFLIDDEGRIAYGAHVPGKAFDLTEIDGYSCKRFSGNDIYISKARIRQIWRGDAIALETLYHEWQHSYDYYSGCADYYFQYYGHNNEACSNWLEFNAYSLNYSRITDAVFLNRIVYYNNRINEWNRFNGY